MQDRNEDQAGMITNRLQTIADEHTLTTIARRTATPQASVHRYLNGARIPADFCARLSQEFQVNPVWLLNGEGARDFSEVSAGTAQLAGNVLELVNAMSAVAHMRLGALTGKHHAKVLRELNDALMRYEGLRKKLNANSEPVFKQVIEEVEKAVKARDWDRASELRKAAAQVERLCDAPDLSHRFTMLQSHVEAGEMNVAESLKFMRNYVRDLIVSGRIVSDENCEAFLRLALNTFAIGQAADGLRLCDAAVALSDDTREGWKSFSALQFLRGHMMVNMGRLHEGIALMQKYLGRVTGNRLPAQRRMFGHALLISGMMRLEEAFHYAEDNEVKALYLLELAVWSEDEDQIRRALEYAENQLGDTGEVFWAHAASALLSASDHKKALAEFQNSIQQKLPLELDLPDYTSACAQIAMATGDTKTARKLIQENDGYLNDPEVMPQAVVMVRARHYRNVIGLNMTGAIRKRANEFFQQHVELGYRLFEISLD